MAVKHIGLIGGIGPAKATADLAVRKGVRFVNHTFTSHLALCASLQPYAGLAEHELCEYPVQSRAVAQELTENHLTPDSAGQIAVPEAPGLGMRLHLETLRRYRVDVEIKVKGRILYRTPAVPR